MFGCVREPGMVPLALPDIFSDKEPRISDLLQGVPDQSMQHSTVKGVQQVIIQNAHQAEILLARGLLKRATAGTNTNSRSSRSQCIINFRQATCEVDDQEDYSELTIVDLAGAERERRTGNQGTRLLESNFINNTSMVFGLCLRALLEYQKNPKRQLQKHFQNSMLTRYLREYLEGKKRMSLILTVKPSEEDYLDTSFVLRQAAPYMQIKFSNAEQPNNLTCKRPLQTLNRAEPLKRRKHTRPGSSEIKYEKIIGDPQIIEEGHATGSVEDTNLPEISMNSEEFSSKKRMSMVFLKKPLLTFTEVDRNYRVLEGLSKAIWKVLKENNKKLKETQQEICILNAELAKERKRCSDLESLVQDVKFRCSCWKEASESNIDNHENLQKPSSVIDSSTMEGSNQNNIEHGQDCIEKGPSACVPSKVMDEISERCSPQAGTSSENVNDRPNHEASDRRTESCLQSCEGLDKTTERYSSGERINHFIDKLESVVYCSDEEACISSVSYVLPLTDSVDSTDSEYLINSQAETSSENVNYRPNHEASDRRTKSCLQSCEGLDETTESYRSGETKNHFIDKLEAAVCCSDEEACISSVADVHPLSNFDDPGVSEDLVNERSPSALVPSNAMVEISKRCTPQLQAGTSSENVSYRPNHEASDTKSCLRSCEGLDKTSESYICGEIKNRFIDNVKAAVNCIDEEACLSSVSDFLPLTNFNDSGNSEDSINVTDARREYMQETDDSLMTGNITDIEIKKLAESAAPLSDSSREILSSCEEEQHLTCSSNLESAVNSFQTPNSTTKDSFTKDRHLEKTHESLIPPHAGMLTEVATCSQECHNNNVSVAACISSKKKDSPNSSKPKRRLLPVSSLLLKDMSILATEDETGKRKGARGDKKVAFDEKIRTQSNTSLLQLLQRNVV